MIVFGITLFNLTMKNNNVNRKNFWDVESLFKFLNFENIHNMLNRKIEI